MAGWEGAAGSITVEVYGGCATCTISRGMFLSYQLLFFISTSDFTNLEVIMLPSFSIILQIEKFN